MTRSSVSDKQLKRTALIMAGGYGERFWPYSTAQMPKQFLSLTDDAKSMIQLTVERIVPLVQKEDIFIATNKEYRKLIREQLPEIPSENILCEPERKNTAPCIGLGAIYAEKKYGNAVMIVLPSDHLVKCIDIYQSVLQNACNTAEQDSCLCTIGIVPNYPETGYGYIEYNHDIQQNKAYKVEKFVEKPNVKLAGEYVADGRHLWNSGMFIWQVSSILDRIRQFMPEDYSRLLKIRKAIGTNLENSILQKEFHQMTAKSIDYAVMEKSRNIFVVPGSFGWDDVGSWNALPRIRQSDEFGNVTSGKIISMKNQNCVLQSKSKKVIAVLGVRNLIVAATDEAVLICSRKYAGEISKAASGSRIVQAREPLFLAPLFKQKIWGGNRLHSSFGYSIPGNDTGEAWGISALPDGDCSVSSGKFSGRTLSQLWEQHRYLFGNYPCKCFPLLVKIIDAHYDLSVQIHPNDLYAEKHEGAIFGKTEGWYIIDCPKNASLVLGHHARTKKELREMVTGGKWQELLNRVPIHKGDFIRIDAGTIHAITAGCLILETSQSSDVTYRIFDYERNEQGKRRKLSIAKAMDVICVPGEADESAIINIKTMPMNTWNVLMDSDVFSVYSIRTDDTARVAIDQKYAFLNMTVVNGHGSINETTVKKGDNIILPYGYGKVELKGALEIIASTKK